MAAQGAQSVLQVALLAVAVAVAASSATRKPQKVAAVAVAAAAAAAAAVAPLKKVASLLALVKRGAAGERGSCDLILRHQFTVLGAPSTYLRTIHFSGVQGW
jgi:hypothetical protein